MTTTISDGSTSVYPELVLSYQSTRTSRNKVHSILGGGIAVSLGAAGLRSGTLELFFPVEEDAAAAEALHSTAGVFTLTDPDRLTIGMAYVVAEDGEVARELDDETRDHWVVSIEYQEVLP